MLSRMKVFAKDPYKILGWVVTRYPFPGKLIPDRLYLSVLFRCIFGRKLDWKNPKSFNEKLQWLKLYDRKPIYTTMVDKYEVKKYVAGIIGEEYIIPTLGVWERFEDIDFDILPDQFVLKCTHDSGGLVICRDKASFDIDAARRKINKCLKKNFYWEGREWPYKNVKPRIIAETYMEDTSTGELRDYKFFTFNGVAKTLFVASERQDNIEETKFDFYDADFKHIDVRNGHPNSNKVISKPETFEKMKELAEKLSGVIPQLRVDFYEVNGKTYFGELTFSHWSGMVPFEPEKWDYTFGEWIKLPESYGGGYALISDNYVLWLHQKTEELSDYKIHCFNGVPKVILVCKDRHTDLGLAEDFFDIEWKHIDVKRPNHRNSDRSIPQPDELEVMLALAKRLSEECPFQRCDFYSVGGRVYFGELTFFPAGGMEKFDPDDFDYMMGEWIKLPNGGE